MQCGNTQIYAHDLRITLARMNEIGKESKVTRFESEFKVSNHTYVSKSPRMRSDVVRTGPQLDGRIEFRP